ncbi:MAG TPA: HAMP domain-containing sensor histidine kinase, partial [bacterium]|nr:HAMP domain-containing sensor histidine kinase [bacterium]
YSTAEIDTLVVTHDGTAVYPADPPRYTRRADWKEFFATAPGRPFLVNGEIAGGRHVIAGVPITGTDLLLLAEADPVRLFAPARTRMLTRIGVGLTLALAPLALLIFLLQRSLAVFERSESEAVRAERLRMLGEASNLIAHEVKNSLNNLRVGIDVLARRSSSEGNRVFDEIRREIQRLSDFTGELMTFSKGVAPRPIELDLCAFVPEVAALSREAASEVGASLDVVTPDAPIRVSADPALVHVVVGNLVSNAVDAVSARQGGGGKVEIRIAAENGSARVRVVDNGPGVAVSVKDHLFEPFVTGKPSGVGIGLALSRKIARAHGGDLVLDSTDPGASFSLVLPIQKEQAT